MSSIKHAVSEDNPILQSAVRRAAKRLIPLLFVMYVFNYLDRTNIAFAGPNGMNEELGLSSTVYGLAAGVFFLGYIVFEVPSNLLLHKFGARRWMARILFTWGVVATALAFVPNAQVLIAFRVLLGVAEAGFFPGIILYLTFWFPAAYRAKMMAIFMTAVPISSAFGAITSTLLIRYTDGFAGFAGWRMMFFIQGAPAILLAFVVWFALTERPDTAKWMPQAERDALREALDAERAQKSAHGPVSVRGALRNPRVFAMAWIYFGISYGLYALSFFLPTIIKGFSSQYGTTFTTVQQGLITAIPYLCGLVAMLVWTRLVKNQFLRVAAPAFVAGIFIPAALYMSNPFMAMIAVTVCACGVMCALPNFWALPTGYLTGVAAAAGIALINSLANLSGFSAPYVTGFLSDLTGTNRAGLWVIGVIMVSAAAVTVILAFRPPSAQIVDEGRRPAAVEEPAN